MRRSTPVGSSTFSTSSDRSSIPNCYMTPSRGSASRGKSSTRCAPRLACESNPSIERARGIGEMSDFEIEPHEARHEHHHHLHTRVAHEEPAVPPLDQVQPDEAAQPWAPPPPAPLAMPSPMPGLFVLAGVDDPPPG